MGGFIYERKATALHFAVEHDSEKVKETGAFVVTIAILLGGVMSFALRTGII